MNAQIPTSLLKTAREEAGINQSQLATELKVSSSVVSRLESTEYADAKMAERYLSAVNTKFAKDIVKYYEHAWKYTERPPFIHPEREVLWSAEKALNLLNEFENGPKFDPILQDPLSKLKNRIITETDFIRNIDHGIAFVGDIGVGKTTALSFVTNLITTNKSGEQKSVFPTGSGRTTVCEVAIKIAPTFGIAVDSLAEEEIRRLVSDLVVGLKTGKTGLPSELGRVIRNMAGLPQVMRRSKTISEKPKTVDPLKEMVNANEDSNQVIADVISRMTLDSRTEAQMILSESAEDSITWLASNIAKINYGQHPNFSVPQRITVLLPLKALRETLYLLSVIDTKGVEGTTQRPDLKAQVDDPRTVIVLCTNFADAPGGTPISMMREVVDSGSDALDAERICLLVLPRDQEALKIVDDSGSNPSDVDQGYAIREMQIEQQLASEGLPAVPINFFNVGIDKPEDIWAWLISIIRQVRLNKVSRVERLIGAADDLVTNSDIAKTRQARRTINETMNGVAERFQGLPQMIRPAHLNLVAEAKKAHQSSIAASINRRGDWGNFQVNHILGVGVKIDANLRTRENFIRIDEQIEGLKEKYAHLLDINQFLLSLQDDLAEWKQGFLSRAALVGRISFARHLEGADELWSDCDKRYGEGSGYRIDVSDLFLKHFEENESARTATQKVDTLLMKIWHDVVSKPLKDAVYFEES